MTDCSSGSPNSRILVVFFEDKPSFLPLLKHFELRMVPTTSTCSAEPTSMLSSELSSMNQMAF